MEGGGAMVPWAGDIDDDGRAAGCCGRFYFWRRQFQDTTQRVLGRFCDVITTRPEKILKMLVPSFRRDTVTSGVRATGEREREEGLIVRRRMVLCHK